jgi:WD40 repeat protein
VHECDNPGVAADRRAPPGISSPKPKGGKTKSTTNSSRLSDDELRGFIAAFQIALQMQLKDGYSQFEDSTPNADGDSPDNHERATLCLFSLFKTFACSESEDADSKHSNSIDVEEFLGACEVLCIAPGPLTKKDAIALFKDVNRSSGGDYDQHEMNKFEFVKSIDLIAKRVGADSIEDLVFGIKGHGSLSARREERRLEEQRAADAILSRVRELGDLDIKMMKEILKIFQARSDNNASEPELDMETFVDVFMPILHQSDHEIQMLFMKIDVNSDGMVSWNEFSSFVLNLHAKEDAAAAMDSILENIPPLFEHDPDHHHEDFIIAAAAMPKLGFICTASADGCLRLWNQITGSNSAGRHARAVPSGKTIISLAVLQQSSMIAVGGDDFKIRFFDPRTLVHELTFDCEGQWPFSMTTFLFPDDHDPNSHSALLPSANQHVLFDDPIFASDKKGFTGWFVWGDGEGELHFMPERQLLVYRTQHEVVPCFRSGVKGLWDLKIFRGHEHATGIWVTEMMFLPDIGIAGIIIAAASNGHICVVSFETRRVFHYYIQHRLSVKALAWCGRQNNLLASAGLDRDIHLWRPVAIRHGRPTLAGALVGHSAGIASLVFHEKRDVLFSLDNHCVTLVWDLSSKTLVTRINPATPNPFDISSRNKLIMVNQKTQHLITASNHLKLWAVRPLDLRDGHEKLVPHASEVVITLYNEAFDLVLTGDRNGLICLWNVKTGAQVFKFFCESVQETYGLPVPSAASFDISQRRLILGWNQGTVQVYNFSNGTILRTLLTEGAMRVTAVGQYQFDRSKESHQYFTAAFEDGLVLQWADDKNPADTPVRKLEVPSWMGMEFSEIAVNAMAGGSIGSGNELQSVLITVRNDGMAFFWDITTGFLLRPHLFNKNSRRKKDQIAGEKGKLAGTVSDGSTTLDTFGPGEIPTPLDTPGAGANLHGPPAAKENLCMQVSANPNISTTCVRILHKCKRIAFIADTEGQIHIVDIETGQRLGCIMAVRKHEQDVEDEEYVAKINAIDIDFTDSFLFVGDEMGELQVWDISQIFDDDYNLTISYLISIFRWKAHAKALTHVHHVRRHNVIITTGAEEQGVCLMWTIYGQRIGWFGHNQWTPDVVRRAIEQGAAGMEEKESLEETETEEDLVDIPIYQRIINDACSHLEEIGQGEKLDLSALKGMLHKDRANRGIKGSIFKMKGGAQLELPSPGETPETERDENTSSKSNFRGQLAITIEYLQHLPCLDKFSKADPYVKVLLGDFRERRTRTFLNQADCHVNETFLYYIDTLDHRLFIEVWDFDNGGDDKHDLVGHIQGTVGFLLENKLTVQCRLPLVRLDGTGAGKLGIVLFKLEFEPIQSVLTKAAPKTLSDHIRGVLRQQGVVPGPQIKSISHHDPETRDRTVTALATTRWKTLDFRNLSVYHLQKDLKLSGHGAMTERNTDRTRGARAGRHVTDDAASDVLAPIARESFRFSKETLSGRLERGLDLALGDLVPLTSLAVNSPMTRSFRTSNAKRQESEKLGRKPASPPHDTLKKASKKVIRISGVVRKSQVRPHPLVYVCPFAICLRIELSHMVLLCALCLDDRTLPYHYGPCRSNSARLQNAKDISLRRHRRPESPRENHPRWMTRFSHRLLGVADRS